LSNYSKTIQKFEVPNQIVGFLSKICGFSIKNQTQLILPFFRETKQSQKSIPQTPSTAKYLSQLAARQKNSDN